ncbi:hypothetical protein HR45_04535 [Shewanella mangrovi]|uniref:Uncharacterized protein n=1 Tax=Shewanella mangrovi TaxID=1515746 RepID=A0A094JFG8_9GAMM|nr:hypothetical protein HR45_04535 [Shewanella mangrovi]
MPIKKWMIQYSVALPVIAILLATIQYLKGRDLGYSIIFGVLWSCITVAIFAARRAYNYRKNIDCIVCNDLSHKTHKNNDKN